MHELSLVQSIFSTLEEQLSQEELETVSLVELQVGLLSNVEPILLQNAFTAYQETRGKYQRVQLQTNLIDIKIHCASCDLESKVENYVFKCSSCGTPSSNIISGNELLIHRIHYDEPVP